MIKHYVFSLIDRLITKSPNQLYSINDSQSGYYRKRYETFLGEGIIGGCITVLFSRESISLSGGVAEFDSFLANSNASGFGTDFSGSLFWGERFKVGGTGLEVPTKSPVPAVTFETPGVD